MLNFKSIYHLYDGNYNDNICNCRMNRVKRTCRLYDKFIEEQISKLMDLGMCVVLFREATKKSYFFTMLKKFWPTELRSPH